MVQPLSKKPHRLENNPYLNTFHAGSKTLFAVNTMLLNNFSTICDALRDLVPFAQPKKREKHPWRSVTFSITFF